MRYHMTKTLLMHTQMGVTASAHLTANSMCPFRQWPRFQANGLPHPRVVSLATYGSL